MSWARWAFADAAVDAGLHGLEAQQAFQIGPELGTVFGCRPFRISIVGLANDLTVAGHRRVHHPGRRFHHENVAGLAPVSLMLLPQQAAPGVGGT